MSRARIKSRGRKLHQVAIKLPSSTTGTLGQRLGGATTVATAYASIETLSGRELEQARKTFAEAKHRVTIWHIAGLTNKHFLSIGARTLGIGHVNDIDNRGVELELLCGEDV